jgi:hypothetical protein
METSKTMRHITTMVATVGIVLTMGWARAEAADAQASTPPPALERPVHFKLVDASPSIDALVGRLIDALAKKDLDALHRVRVTESEYRTFLLPGAGDPGQPGRVYDDASSKFAWGQINTNSFYAAAGIMSGYGGRKLKVKDITFLKGRKEYAWYTAYRTVGLKLEDENGKESELVLGSIAEIDGQFKFVSLLGKQ